MGRVSSITYAQVAEIANSIRDKGGKPGIREIHRLLGAGSNTTVIKLLQEWNSQQALNVPLIDPLLSPSITRALNTLIHTKVVESTANITAQLEERQTECDILITENSDLTNEVESQAEELSEIKKRQAELRGRIQQFEVDALRTAAELTTERKQAEAVRLELAKIEIRLELLPHLEAEIERMSAELKEANNYSAKCHESAAVAQAKFELLDHSNRLAEQTRSLVNEVQMKNGTSKAQIF